MQAMVSTPLALIASACCTKPGRCLALQVGVNAPGTANSTTFLPLKISSVEPSFGPSFVAIISFITGIVSPTLMAISGASLGCQDEGVVTPRRARVKTECLHATPD